MLQSATNKDEVRNVPNILTKTREHWESTTLWVKPHRTNRLKSNLYMWICWVRHALIHRYKGRIYKHLGAWIMAKSRPVSKTRCFAAKQKHRLAAKKCCCKTITIFTLFREQTWFWTEPSISEWCEWSTSITTKTTLDLVGSNSRMGMNISQTSFTRKLDKPCSLFTGHHEFHHACEETTDFHLISRVLPECPRQITPLLLGGRKLNSERETYAQKYFKIKICRDERVLFSKKCPFSEKARVHWKDINFGTLEDAIMQSRI